jgi:predicted acylesterase/phospholipase RssA/CRP-like cAMP-binding protein
MITAGSELIDSLLLDGLAPEDQSRLASLFTRLEYPAGAEIIRQGEPCGSLYIVESGSVLVHSSQQGQLAHRGPGECLGELSMFTAGPASATVTAVTDVVVQAIPQAQMRPLLEEVPVLARNFCRLLGRRLVASSQMAERSPLTLLCGAASRAGMGLALNLAASLAHHLQDKVALVDLSAPADGPGVKAAPTFEEPLERLTLVRTGRLAPDDLPPLVDALARQYRHVLAWAPEEAAERLDPISLAPDRLLVAADYETCRRMHDRSWLSPWTTNRAHEAGSMGAAEWLVLGVPEPRSSAAIEAIEQATGLPAAGLLPDPPAALKTEPEWVLRCPDAPFARETARLARRLLGKTVGLALGCGAGRGHAHVGVLQALERRGVRPDFLAGASIGACVALFYACGIPFHEMELSVRRLGQCFRQRALPVYSFLAGTGLDRVARTAVPPGLRMQDLALPCGFVAADLHSGGEVLLREGDGWLCARASSTIPGVFPPARLDGRLLVDGGIVSPVPCHAVRRMGADIVLGVSLETASLSGTPPINGSSPRVEEPGKANPAGSSTLRKGRRAPTWPTVLLRALELLQQSLTQQCLQAADVPIRVFTPPTSLTDFAGGPEFLEAGELAVEVAQERLRELLPWTR